MTYTLHLLVYFEIYAILALSLNLVVGYCGLLTLAHAAYFAVGAYTYALSAMYLPGDFPIAAGISMLVAFILSLATSLPAWHFRGDLFVLVSLAVQSMIFSIIYNWTSLAPAGTMSNLTNGPFGLTDITPPGIFGWSVSDVGDYALLGSLLLSISLMLIQLLTLSPWGRLLKCMRDDELAARSLGKNIRLAKVQAIAFACAFAGLAGAFYASYVRFLDPSVGSLDESILMLSMLLIGGAGNLRGPMLGAAVLIMIPEMLRIANLPDPLAANLRLLLYGLLLIVMTHWRPQGLAGDYRIR